MPGIFPNLRTGKVAQYPFERNISYATDMVQFLDQSEQVYQDGDAARRRWILSLHELDDNEIATLRDFFEQQQGGKGDFSFTDPYDSTTIPACSFLEDAFPITQGDEALNEAVLTIFEHP